MSLYRFRKPYISHVGTWSVGDVTDFDDDTAAWLLRDVAGCIESVDVPPAPEPTTTTAEPTSTTPEPETRAQDSPPKDRQVKRATRKRGGG